jgi:hypothetical protein
LWNVRKIHVIGADKELEESNLQVLAFVKRVCEGRFTT